MMIFDKYDDFFTIEGLAVLHKVVVSTVYDFDFRNNFECRSVMSPVDAPILLHIGAVEDYKSLEDEIESFGRHLRLMRRS